MMKCRNLNCPTLIKILCKDILIFSLVFLFLFLQSCTKTKVDPPEEWTYGKSSVTLEYSAEENLNEVDGKQHALLLVIYQLKDLNAFNQLASYKEGLGKLLGAESFDPSVMAVDKIFIEPGAKGSLKYDRAENAQHLGIVAGYYDLNPSKSVLLVDIQYEKKRTGMLKLSKTIIIDPLTINIVLEKNGLRLEKKDNDS